MTRAQISFAVAGVLAGLLAWDDWQLRTDLAQLRQANAAQASVIATKSVAQPEEAKANCPVNAVAATADKGSAEVPRTADAKAGSNHNTTEYVIPPGTNLLEALRIVQREQAKNPPQGIATISPFGTSP